MDAGEEGYEEEEEEEEEEDDGLEAEEEEEEEPDQVSKAAHQTLHRRLTNSPTPESLQAPW